MDIGLFARGVVLGFTIAAAVGPIALLTIRRTLAYGQRIGLASGAGVATADGFYGAVAAFGLTAISDVLVSLAVPLGLIGGAFVVFIGIRTARSRPDESVPAANEGEVRTGDGALSGTGSKANGTANGSRSIATAYLSMLGLTLTNPLTILSFAALFVGLGVVGHGGLDAALLTAGVFLGSMAWWVLLTSVVARLRSRITPRALRWVNVVSGTLIAIFGLVAIVTVIRR